VEHLAALIARCKPGLSVRKIAEDAGLAHNRLAYYLKPGSKVTRLPEKDTIVAFARALGCTEKEVIDAFLADIYGVTD
jgi:DNA-binding phage protein